MKKILFRGIHVRVQIIRDTCSCAIKLLILLMLADAPAASANPRALNGSGTRTDGNPAAQPSVPVLRVR